MDDIYADYAYQLSLADESGEMPRGNISSFLFDVDIVVSAHRRVRMASRQTLKSKLGFDHE